jgi:hypothetical protein
LELIDPLTLDPEAFSGGDENPDMRSRTQDGSQQRGSVKQVFEVIEHQQQATRTERGKEMGVGCDGTYDR